MANEVFLSPRRATEVTAKNLYAGRVPYLRSSPGMGKSSIYAAFAKENRLKMIDIRLSMYSPLDINGLPTRVLAYDTEGNHMPEGDTATFLPFQTFPLASTPIPEGYDGWFLLLDEFNSAPKSVEAASYKLTLDRFAGDNKLNDNVVIALAGNLDTDRAITSPSSTASLSRVSTTFMHIDPGNSRHREEFFADVVFKQKWASIIPAYLSWKPQHINTFVPASTSHTFGCPRTWSFINDLLQSDPDNIKDVDVLGSNIGYEIARELVMFGELMHELPSVKELIADPLGYDLSGKARGLLYGIVTSLVGNTTDESLKPILKFIQRPELGVEFKALYVRSINGLHSTKFQFHPDMIDAQASVQEHLSAPRF